LHEVSPILAPAASVDGSPDTRRRAQPRSWLARKRDEVGVSLLAKASGQGTLSFGLLAVPGWILSAVRVRDIYFHEIGRRSAPAVSWRRSDASR
jgi:hypothetical protein